MGLVLAYLVANGAACFASRLARGLAFAAAASLQGLLKLLSADRFDVFRHFPIPLSNKDLLVHYSTYKRPLQALYARRKNACVSAAFGLE